MMFFTVAEQSLKIFTMFRDYDSNGKIIILLVYCVIRFLNF